MQSRQSFDAGKVLTKRPATLRNMACCFVAAHWTQLQSQARQPPCHATAAAPQLQQRSAAAPHLFAHVAHRLPQLPHGDGSGGLLVQALKQLPQALHLCRLHVPRHDKHG